MSGKYGTMETKSTDIYAFPVSLAQQRLWFVDQLQPGDAAYHIAGAVRFTGELDVPALDASIRHVVSRHESLRTTFEMIDVEVMQIIHAEFPVGLQVTATDLSIGRNRAAFIGKLSAIAEQPFDLVNGPLLRAILLRTSAEDQTLLVVIHHIVADGWSLMVLIREVVESYKAFKLHAQPQLPALPVQYADYAVWQQRYLAYHGLDEAISYWKEKLSGFSTCTVPADYERPTAQAHRGARQSLDLTKETSEGVLNLCQREQATPFMVLLAALKILLYRYTGNNDVLVGTPVAGRNRVELENLIGCFVNLVALRTEIRECASFVQVLRQVKEVTLQASSHNDLPFERVLMEINPTRDLSQAPIFQVFFDMLNFPEALEVSLPDVQTELIELPETRSKFDVTLYVKEHEGIIKLDLEYDLDLFAPGRIAEMLRQYEHLLKQAVNEPEKETGSLSLVTEPAMALLPDPIAPPDYVDGGPESGRRKEILLLGDGLEGQLLVVSRARQLCGVGEVGEIYLRSPHIAAGFLDDEDFSRQEDTFVVNWFTRRKDDLLHRTGDLGRYRPDGTVELLGRADKQVNIRGFRVEEWNATAREYPKDKCIHVLFAAKAAQKPIAVAVEDADVQLSYGELEQRANALARYLRRMGVGPEVRVGICVERSAQMVVGLLGVLKAGGAYVPLDASYPAERLNYILQDAQASVLLTQEDLMERLPVFSGTVVRLDREWPKIAEESTSSVSGTALPENLAYVMYTSGSTGKPKGVQIQHRAVVNFLSAMQRELGIHADDVLLAVTTLSFDIAGLELFLPLVSGARVRILGREASMDAERLKAAVSDGITIMQATPASWLLLRHAGWQGNPGLRALCGGESVPAELVRALARGTSSAWNMYGPTETTIWSVVGKMEATDERVSIGWPIANTQVYVLDGHMQPVPIGSIGELYIGGDGLARGYLNRGDLTTERFVPNPFSERKGERLYRTGDLTRHLPDGRLEFLGRTDSQIKIRGYRIELGEIEAILEQIEGITRAVVVSREDEPGEKRLIAYLVESREISHIEISERLRQRLPNYMLPSAFVALGALPLTPNGKLNRNALPAPAPDEFLLEESYAAPRTSVEEIIAGIWAEMLHVRQVGVNQNFFELGGYSIIAAQVIARIKASLGIELPVRALFEHPTVEQLARELERWGGKQSAGDERPIVRVSRDQGLPLSYAQQRLWFIDQLEPGRATYNIPMGVRLEGDLDVEALRLSLQEIVRRHEVLRTRFITVQGAPQQIIEEPAELGLELVDCRDFDEQAIAAAMRAEASRPFDLSTGPLFRMRILRLSEREHLLLATMHHIVSDGWSIGILIEEFTALYSAFKRREGWPLSEPKVQYADYAIWQQTWLQRELLEKQIAYWREQLEGMEPLELPVDYARPAGLSGHGGAVPVELNPTTGQRLRELSRRENVTLFMVLLAAWQVLLSRYSSQRDVAVGTDVANRSRAETEKLIGFFVNQLVLRAHIRSGEIFTSLLRRLRSIALGAYEHQDVPFEKLVEELAPGRDLSRSPLFQVKLVLNRVPHRALALEGLKLSPITNNLEFTKLDLRLGLFEQRDGSLTGWLEYSSDLFARETVERMVQHWVTLIEGIARNAEQKISGLPLLTEAEQEQILQQWSSGAQDLSRSNVLGLFEQQADTNEIAIVYDGQSLSYTELNLRANQLGHHLQRLGVRPEVQVGLCAERGWEFFVGMLGILKAGGAFVPLDPNYPSERLGYILEDTQAPVLLTQARLQERLPSSWAQVVLLDDDWNEIGQQPHHAPKLGVVAANLAYVLFTSGSTGQPKGVAVAHGALSNYVHAIMRVLDLRQKATYALVSTMAADLGYTGIFGALCSGGTLHVISEERVLDPDAMAAYFTEHGIDCCKAVPSLCQALMRGKRAQAVIPRQCLVLGGEALSWQLIKEIKACGGDCRIYNHYGPSETTIGVLTAAITEVENKRTGTAPIGKPIANSWVYVLDENQMPVPCGVNGELYIGGPGLARGYLYRPAMTAEKFVPDPFSREAGARLYRTGDLVKWRGDGQLEFVGRIDHQVKVRGYRIELGEIEAVLREHAEVERAAVILREDTPGDRLVVAYVVAQSAQTSGNQLRTYIKERLPHYMAPSAFVFVPTLPFTANGKLDRRALPKPQAPATGHSEAVQDLAAEEEIVAGIWAEALRVSKVGSHDNFFDLGGHSLLAIQVISRVRDAFEIELPLRVIFDSPTVAGMLEHLKGQGREKRPALRKRERDGDIPLSYAQQRFWFLHQLAGGGSVYHVSAVMELRGELNVPVLERSFREVLRRHEMLRTRLPLRDGTPVQVVEPVADWRLPILDLSGSEKTEAEAEARRIVREQQKQPFDLAKGPLLRTLLMRFGPEEHLLVSEMHHLVADGWSLDILTDEIGRFYGNYLQQQDLCLPELPIQYADYALWEREWLTGEVLESRLRYWRQQLEGVETQLRLSQRRPRPAVPSFRGASQPVELSVELARQLRALSRREGTTLFMTMLAGFMALLHQYTGQEDLVVGSVIANRERAELERLVGFLANTLVLRVQLSGDLNVRQVLQRVRETCLQAYAHQLPPEKLLEGLAQERSGERHPLYEVWFQLGRRPRETFDFGGVQWKRVEEIYSEEREDSRFEFSLTLYESDRGITGDFKYDSDLFSSTIISQMIEDYTAILGNMPNAPEVTLSELQIADQPDTWELTATFGGSPENFQ